MSRLLPLLLFFSFLLMATGCQDSNRKILSEVDKAVKRSPLLEARAHEKADSISRRAINISDSLERTELELAAAREWLPVDAENAISHLRIAVRLSKADNAGDSIKGTALLSLASAYLSQGSMTKDASDVLKETASLQLPAVVKEDYFTAMVLLNTMLARQSMDPALKRDYINASSAFNDSLAAVNPQNIKSRVGMMLETGEYRKALDLLDMSSGNRESGFEEEADYYGMKAQTWMGLENADSQIYYLAKASLADFRNGVGNPEALPSLAQALESRDIKRAYNYIRPGLKNQEKASYPGLKDDKTFMADNILKTYDERLRKETGIAVIIFFLVSVLLCVLLWIRKHEKNPLHVSGLQGGNESKEITDLRKRLDEEDAKIRELENILRSDENKIRYRASLTEMAINNVSLFERLEGEIEKLKTKGAPKELTQKLGRWLNREESAFYDEFDKIFLKLTPDFIRGLNSLLKPGERYEFTEGKLSTELRIYALVSLGIIESNRIAAFLRCSDSTVYNYRTRIRNKAINRETFETDFANITG